MTTHPSLASSLTDWPVLLAEARILLSYWKPVVPLIFLAAWAWIITTIYDKHTARFFLPRRQWNIVHMCIGLAAVVAMIGVPVLLKGSEGAFWAGLGAMIVLLAIDVVVYPVVANKDERVPEEHQITLSSESWKQKREEKAKAKLQGSVALTIKSPDEKGKPTVVVPAPEAETPEFETRITAEKLFIAAQTARATQMEIGPAGKDGSYGVAVIVDSVRQALGELMPAAVAARVIDFFKSAAKLDVADRRKRQAGMFLVERDMQRIGVQAVAIGAAGGMRLTLVFDPDKQVTKPLEKLGLLDMQLKLLGDLRERAQGVVLLSAPPDMGRTSTMYAIVRKHDAYTTNVQTLETDVQGSLEGVRQNKFDATAEGAEFATTVRSILRRDPDVVGIAELPDVETAREIAKVDPERTIVYVSMRGDSALSTIQTWAKAVGDAKAASGPLRGVLSQRLIRKLCTNCRVPYAPSPEMLKKLGVPEGKVAQLYKKGGQVLIKNKPETCPVCQGGGYIGVEGIFEVYQLGEDERAILAKGDLSGLKGALRKQSQPTMQQCAIRKAVEGITSVEEVMRVTAEGSGGGGGEGKAAGGGASRERQGATTQA